MPSGYSVFLLILGRRSVWDCCNDFRQLPFPNIKIRRKKDNESDDGFTADDRGISSDDSLCRGTSAACSASAA
ncbi:hypothetical protein M1271_00290 [Patescibacteria group bacterium]|nr:hypothetical protein [Patescibacteria group bacterium]